MIHFKKQSWQNKLLRFRGLIKVISDPRLSISCRCKGADRGHQRAGSVLPPLSLSPPQQQPARQTKDSVQQRNSRLQNTAVRAREVAEVFDGSDLDVSDSLPNDNCSPILTGSGRPPKAASTNSAQSEQPVYAVVKKKKPNKAKEETVPAVKPRVAPKPARLQQQPAMADPPRSPINIPLIRISQTESVEKADKSLPSPTIKEPEQVRKSRLHLYTDIQLD